MKIDYGQYIIIVLIFISNTKWIAIRQKGLYFHPRKSNLHRMLPTIKLTFLNRNNRHNMFHQVSQHIHLIKPFIVPLNNIVIWMHIMIASNISVSNIGISSQTPISFREMSLRNSPIRTHHLSCKQSKSSFRIRLDHHNSLAWYFQATSVMWVTERSAVFRVSTWRVAFRSVSTRARAKRGYWLTRGIIWTNRNYSMLINKLTSRIIMVGCFQ